MPGFRAATTAYFRAMEAMTTRLVFLTSAAMPSQSYGMIVRKSNTATLMPSFSACWAASIGQERRARAPMAETIRGVAPFVALMFGFLLIVMSFPGLSLWLPSAVYD